MIREAIAYNVAKPNERFVGYVDGQYRAQSRQQAPGPQASLARDAAFTRLVAPLTSPAEGRYHHPDIGEVLYVAVPVTQALVALADNACRYTEPGDRIAVGSMLDRGWLRFWITDSGRGVSDQDRSHIFERFSRAA